MSVETKRGYTREEAAEYAGISVYKIRTAIRDNHLIAKQVGKDIIVLRDDLDQWIDSWDVA